MPRKMIAIVQRVWHERLDRLINSLGYLLRLSLSFLTFHLGSFSVASLRILLCLQCLYCLCAISATVITTESVTLSPTPHTLPWPGRWWPSTASRSSQLLLFFF